MHWAMVCTGPCLGSGLPQRGGGIVDSQVLCVPLCTLPTGWIALSWARPPCSQSHQWLLREEEAKVPVLYRTSAERATLTVNIILRTSPSTELAHFSPPVKEPGQCLTREGHSVTRPLSLWDSVRTRTQERYVLVLSKVIQDGKFQCSTSREASIFHSWEGDGALEVLSGRGMGPEGEGTERRSHLRPLHEFPRVVLQKEKDTQLLQDQGAEYLLTHTHRNGGVWLSPRNPRPGDTSPTSFSSTSPSGWESPFLHFFCKRPCSFVCLLSTPHFPRAHSRGVGNRSRTTSVVQSGS